MSSAAEGLLFDVQAHSVHDGPGCRTTVFLSGCPLRCSWCANPEGLLLRSRLMVRGSRCRPDGYPCAAACSRGAIRVDSANPLPPLFDRQFCATCEDMPCASACPFGALDVSGRRVSVSDLLRTLERDRDYWGEEGGVTFSGGEPLFQPRFLMAALAACHDAYIHTVVETSAYAEVDLVLDVSRRVDWLFADLKHMDSAVHERGTGVGNETILRNLECLAGASGGAKVIIRVPVIPGFNDSLQNLRATARFLSDLGLREVNLLPFHRMAESKYAELDLAYPHAETVPPTPAEMNAHQRVFAAAGLDCYVGAETPF